jgi:hypothetical protein
MKTVHENGGVTDAIGFINLGTMAVPRKQLAKWLPDVERFERWLPVTQRTDAYMTAHDGATPPEFKAMSVADCSAVLDTMRELGELQTAAARELKAELARRERP